MPTSDFPTATLIFLLSASACTVDNRVGGAEDAGKPYDAPTTVDTDTGADTGADTGDTAADTTTTDTQADSGGGTTTDSGGDSGTDTTTDTWPPSSVAIVSDGTWRVTGLDEGEAAPADWMQPTYDDSAWALSVSPNVNSCGATFSVTTSWEQPAGPMWNLEDSYGVLFRKVFTIGDVAALTESRITTYADDDVAVWVNGTELFYEADFGMDEDTGFDNTIVLNLVDLAPALVSGDNVIAVHAQDTAGGCRSAFVSGTVTTL